MTTIHIAGPQPYDIVIKAGAIQDEESLRTCVHGNDVLVISDVNVTRWHDVFPDAPHHILEAGESSKDLANYGEVLRKLADIGAKRDATIIALGGGVVGDLAGFAAATWMRGIDFVQVPTTLLAMVDSSVGGKTAIDLEAGKNLVGAFHSPVRVVIDPEVLDTLPSREFNAGMAEVLKYGMIFDQDFLSWIEDSVDFIGARDAVTMEELIARCVRFKAEVVSRDPLEHGERALLNFGHTFAHAIETEQQYGELNHGEAVAIGMVLATRLSGLDPARLIALLRKFNLPTTTTLPADQLLQRMQLDKKATRHGMRFIVLDDYGAARVADDLTLEQVRAALAM